MPLEKMLILFKSCFGRLMEKFIVFLLWPPQTKQIFAQEMDIGKMSKLDFGKAKDMPEDSLI